MLLKWIFFARFQCRLRDGPVCVWNSQNRRVLIVMYPAFLKFVKPVCILKCSSWIEKDLNHWNVGVDWFATVWVSTWFVANFIGVGRIFSFQFQTLLNCCFQYLKFTLGTCKLEIIHWWDYIVFHARIVRWIFRPSVVSVISEFSLIWTTDYCIWSLFSI